MTARRVRFWLVVLGVLLVVGCATLAHARPGGGHTFSGGRASGGRSFSGGGRGSHGGDGGLAVDLVILFVRLIVVRPAIGVPILVCVIAVVVYKQRVQAASWHTRRHLEDVRVTRTSSSALRLPRRELATAASAADPDFSLVLFEDFLYALFARAHEARGAGTLDALAPYLSPEARAAFHPGAQPLAEVKAVVVGAIRFVAARHDHARLGATVDFEANYTQVARSGAEQAFYVTERWRLSRSRAARSRPPERSRVFGCPNCGAPLTAIRGGKCGHCDEQVDGGEHDWRVDAIQVLAREQRGPQLLGDVAERGTDLPTVVDRQAHAHLAELAARDPAFTLGALRRRVELIFAELQAGWSTLELLRARPYLSDNLFQMLLYWTDAYRRAGLRNVLEESRVLDVELASVAADRHFDAVTLRVFATGLDYTVNAKTGEVASGSRRAKRAYSEYWTLVRSAGRSGEPRVDPSCPNCGAELKIGMTGACEYCRAKVTSGEFDWVLSRIEQDEAYTG